jgi:hypothetical protein
MTPFGVLSNIFIPYFLQAKPIDPGLRRGKLRRRPFERFSSSVLLEKVDPKTANKKKRIFHGARIIPRHGAPCKRFFAEVIKMSLTAKNIYINLPVKDLRRSTEFFGQIGFQFDER